MSCNLILTAKIPENAKKIPKIPENAVLRQIKQLYLGNYSIFAS